MENLKVEVKRNIGDKVWIYYNLRPICVEIGSVRADGWCWVRWWKTPRKGYTMLMSPTALYDTKEELLKSIGLWKTRID